MTRIAFIALVSIALGGCATAYQSGGITGGYYQVSGPGSLEKITFSGNGYISAETVQQYALYRSAEAAKEKNKPYFIIYESLLAAAANKPSEKPGVGAIGNKPMAVAFVLMLDKPQEGAKETAKVLKDLDAVVKPQPKQAQE